MPRGTTIDLKPPIPAQLVKVKVQGDALIKPLAQAVEELSVTDADEYQQADELLAGIRAAIRAWGQKMEPVLKPLREAKSAADKLNRDILRPMEELEAKVKEQMRLYKVAEQDEIQRQRRLQEQAEAKIQAQLEEAARKEQQAKVPSVKQRLAQSRERLEERLQEVQDETPAPVKASHSSVRKIKKWRMTNGGLDTILKAIRAGETPMNVVVLDYSYINRQMMQDPDVVAGWPGFEVYEETIIAGR